MANHRRKPRVDPAWAVAAIGLLAAGSIATTAPAFAQTQSQTKAPAQLTEAQALAAVRKDFAIPASFKVTQEQYNNQQNNGPANYGFTFSYNTPTGQQQYINASVEAANGMVLNYYGGYPQGKFTFPPKESQAMAQQKAVSLARQLYPTQYPQTRLQPVVTTQGALTQPISYTFNFQRYVHGLRAPFDGLSITVDQNGVVDSVNASWTTNSPFPAPSSAISPSAAAQSYARHLDIHLAYTTVWQTVTSQVYLAYVQPQQNYPNFWNNQFDTSANTIGLPVLNAQNGQPVNSGGQTQAMPVYHAPHPLVANGPQVNPYGTKANWTEAQALHYAEQAAGITSADHLTGTSQMMSQPGSDNQWTFNWSGPQSSTVSATVDATWGALVNYNSYTPVKAGTSTLQQKLALQKKFGQPATITQSQATAAATNFVRRAFPHDTGGLAVSAQPWQNPPGSKVATSFSITPLLHGLPLQGNTGNIDVNGQTGQVQDFWWQPSQNGPAPASPTKAISLAQAERDWVQQQPLRLEYLLTQPQMAAKYTAVNGKSPVSPGAPRVILAYAPQTSQYSSVFNAATGRFMVSPGIAQPYSGPITGLSGVPQATQITLLVRRGLLQTGAGGVIQPQHDMTRAAFVSLLANTLGLNSGGPITAAMQHSLSDVASASPAYQSIRGAYANGWLPAGDLFHPNQLVTRALAANILAHALGYGALLSHPAMFHLTASDAASVPPSEYAAAALSASLGLLPLQQGAFHATGPVTIAQAAAAAVTAATYYTPSGGFCMGCMGGGQG